MLYQKAFVSDLVSESPYLGRLPEDRVDVILGLRRDTDRSGRREGERK